MQFNPPYFCKSRHGVYVFRFSLPKPLYNHFGSRRELKISLRTKTRQHAMERYFIVYRWVAALMQDITVLIKKNNNMSTQDLESIIGRYKTKIHNELVDEHAKLTADLLATERELREAKKALYDKDKLIDKVIEKTVSSPSLIEDNKTGLTVAGAIVKYVEFKIQRDEWATNTLRQAKQNLNLFADITGHYQDVSELGRDLIDHYQTTLRRLPKNLKQHVNMPKSPDKRPAFLSRVATKNTKAVRAAGGLESHFKDVKGFLIWCENNSYINKAHTHLLKVSTREAEQTKTEPLPFSPEALTTLFTSPIYTDQLMPKEQPYEAQFWFPLIGLFTGARISEIANLKTKDVRMVAGVLCFDINGDQLKTKQSKRLVPVASKLIECGFVEFLSWRQNDASDPWLFTNLSKTNDRGRSPKVSKWFNSRYLKRIGLEVSDNERLSFHSFRHTFINNLRATRHHGSLVPEYILVKVVGHKTGTVTHDSYGHDIDPALIKSYIDRIDFGVDLSNVHFDRFKRRR